VLDFSVQALAAARIVRLIQTDSITETHRKLVLDWLYARKRYRVMELLDCPWCASVHVMAGLTILRMAAPRLHTALVGIMAGSYVASTVVELSARLSQD
jgi:hypothetical protein